VNSSASQETLEALAKDINDRIAAIVPKGKAVPSTAPLLAALSLAHELREERERRHALEARTRDVLRSAITRVDRALRERS
jgi:cell division protein ZapA (FtsZ GTPase activity inhibitor)